MRASPTVDGDQLGPRLLINRWLWCGGLAVAIVQVIWSTRRAALFQDDFIFLGEGQIAAVRDGQVVSTTPSWDYLSKALFEHFSPVTRFLFWVLGSADDPRLVGRVMVLVLLGFVIVSFGVLTHTVLGRTLPALLLAMVGAQALVLTRLGAWTTASFNILPSVACGALSLSLAYRYLRDPSRRAAAAGSAVLYGIAVLDYEIAMLLPLFVAGWFALCVAPEIGRDATIDRVRATLGYWVVLMVIGAAAALNYRLNYYFDELPRGTVGSSLRTLWYSLFQGLFPAIIGVYRPVAGDYGWPTVVTCVVWLGVVGAAAILGGWAAVRAMALGAGAWLVCNGLLAYGRSAVNGTSVGMELYYAAFPMLVVLLAACEVVRAALRRRAPERDVEPVVSFAGDGGIAARVIGPARASAPRLVAGGLAAAVLASGVMLQVHADTLTSVSGVARFSRDFAARFLDDVSAADAPPHVLSYRVPGGVVFSQFYPYDWASRNVGQLTDDVAWNTVGDGSLFRIGDDGSLDPIEIRPIQEFTLPGAEYERGASRNEESCLVFGSSGSLVRLNLPEPAEGLGLALRLRGRVDRSTVVVPGLRTADGLTQDLTGDLVEWTEGDIDTVLWLSAESVGAVELSGLVAGTTLCLDEASIVQIRNL